MPISDEELEEVNGLYAVLAETAQGTLSKIVMFAAAFLFANSGIECEATPAFMRQLLDRFIAARRRAASLRE